VATDKRTLRILARRLGYADSHPERQLTDDYRHYTERIRQLFDHYLKA
jgi:hypothetical protein